MAKHRIGTRVLLTCILGIGTWLIAGCRSIPRDIAEPIPQSEQSGMRNSGLETAGPPRLELLGEKEWTLDRWDLHEAKTDTVPVTLAFTQGQFAGSAGCNRYFAKVEEKSTPGEISIGPVGATRKMCSPEEMKTEDRFLGVLPLVRSYRFWNSKLALVYVEKETTRTLLFRR